METPYVDLSNALPQSLLEQTIEVVTEQEHHLTALIDSTDLILRYNLFRRYARCLY